MYRSCAPSTFNDRQHRDQVALVLGRSNVRRLNGNAGLCAGERPEYATPTMKWFSLVGMFNPGSSSICLRCASTIRRQPRHTRTSVPAPTTASFWQPACTSPGAGPAGFRATAAFIDRIYQRGRTRCRSLLRVADDRIKIYDKLLVNFRGAHRAPDT